jgi:hypothetical protein
MDLSSQAKALAKELLDIQQGSVEDAVKLAEDIPDYDLRTEVLKILDEKARDE